MLQVRAIFQNFTMVLLMDAPGKSLADLEASLGDIDEAERGIREVMVSALAESDILVVGKPIVSIDIVEKRE